MGYDMGLKTIKFNDLNWEKDYTPNNAYSQSKLAQIMTIYELQQRLKDTGKTDVKGYACHPGSSRTNLINTSGSFQYKKQALNGIYKTDLYHLINLSFTSHHLY